jgi:polyphosphate kinase
VADPADKGEAGARVTELGTARRRRPAAARAAARKVKVPPDRFLNRELSWLDWNTRVMEVAEDPSVPLLERIRLCSFVSSGLDEFFMVRVAGLTDQAEAGIDARRCICGTGIPVEQ